MRGIILRADGDELIVQATAADVRQFAARSPVDVRMRTTMTMGEANAAITGASVLAHAQPGDQLYTRLGQPVGVVESINITRGYLDVTTYANRDARLAVGPMSWTIRIEGHE